MVDDYELASDTIDKDTGMWKVRVRKDPQTWLPICYVIPLVEIFHAAHLIPVFKGTPDTLSKETTFETSLDKYDVFYVNTFIDYHAFEILSHTS